MPLQNVEDIYPLSPMQGLMLTQVLSGADPTLLVNQARYEIQGPLRGDLLRRAWARLVERHGALRTAVLWKGLDRPVQVVRRGVDVSFEEIDLRGQPPARVQELADEDAATPMDLGVAPLMRCTLLRTAEDRHVLLWTAHHLVIDRWSHDALFSELALVYRELSGGQEADLPPAAGFRSYIAWLRDQDDPEGTRFWTEELRDFRRSTPLANGGTPSVDGERRTARRLLSADTTARLRANAAAWRSTLAAQVLGAIAIALARRNRSGDVVYGLTVSGRPAELPEVEHTVGSFVNNVPLRVRLDPEDLVLDLVRTVQRSHLRRARHEHVSPAVIHDVSDLPPDQALFDLLVVLNLGERSEPDWLDLEIRPVGATFDAAYPFLLGIAISEGRLELKLVHDSGSTGAEEALESIARALGDLAGATHDTTVGDLLPGIVFSSTPMGRVDLGSSSAGESGPLDLAVAEIWQDVLGLDRVTADDDFFELGGTSLQALRILRRVERRAGRALSISDFFGAPSVRGILSVLGETPEPAPSDAILRAPRTGPLPLSFAQERLWALDRIEGESAVYNLPVAVRLSGPLDADRLRAALTAVVERHEVLRTRYPSAGGSPHQAIADEAASSWGWAEETLEALGPQEARERVESVAAEPFQLATGPVFRATLFRLGAEDHVFLMSMHHSVADGWSVRVLTRDLSRAYRSFPDRPAWDPLPVHYADYAAWQRGLLDSPEFEEKVAWWRDRLSDLAPLDLPTDRSRPTLQSFRGAVHRVEIAPPLAEALRRLGRREGTTLFMTLTAALRALLYRYTGQTDIAIGTPYAGRTRAEAEDMVGMFVNTLLIRADVRRDMSFRDLLTDVREESTAAHARQDVPFEKLVEVLQPERDLSRHPLFQIMFALQDPEGLALELDGIDVGRYDLDQDISKFDLTLYLQETTTPDGDVALEGLWEYATDLFDASTIERMQGHFVNLLESVAADPSQPISGLRLLSERERASLLGPEADASAPELFLDRFEASVRSHGDRVAIVDGDQSVTYQELDARANRLARHLIELGAAPEVLVGIALERSADLVVAMLAALKSGGAYLPLDPEYPAERLTYMLEDGAATILVTTTGILTDLEAFQGSAVCLDRDESRLQALSSLGPDVEIGPDQLAYTIYTSGSTGRPKGVDVTHGNLAHFLEGMIEYPGLFPEDVVLARTTPAFDPSVVELLGTLLVGARMVIARPEEMRDGEGLGRVLARARPTLLQATPATFTMLFEAGWTGDPDLRVLVGGEALSPELAARLVESCGEVWNIYGPTEGTVWATCWKVEGDLDQIRIGTAIGARRLLVLDEDLRPVPVGVRGELFVGGAGVTRGYRNRPEETARSYLPDPFSSRAGARLFRTGDLVRYRDDGTLEFFGRADHQVKVRGFRIELGELETVLVEHADIQRAVAAVADSGTPHARLIAYVILAQGASLTPSEIRRYLRERLPSYMIPGIVMELDAFPLTPSGKVDRAAMPDAIGSGATSGARFIPPATPAEERLAEVWSELLQVDRIGRFDNFFQLGGHSLLSLRAVAMVAERHGHAMDPRAMFFQTLAQLAEQFTS